MMFSHEYVYYNFMPIDYINVQANIETITFFHRFIKSVIIIYPKEFACTTMVETCIFLLCISQDNKLVMCDFIEPHNWEHSLDFIMSA